MRLADLTGVALSLLLLTGCGTVRGMRSISLKTPCMGSCQTSLPYQYDAYEERPDYVPYQGRPAPVPPVIDEPTPVREEQIPPPPPGDFEARTQPQPTRFKPLLVPIKEKSARIAEKTADSAVSFYDRVKRESSELLRR